MNRMAFGLCYSQATYQRLMNNTLREIRNSESYVDDICVYSDNFHDQLTYLRQTLAALRGANIQLRRDKCTVLPNSCTDQCTIPQTIDIPLLRIVASVLTFIYSRSLPVYCATQYKPITFLYSTSLLVYCTT